MQSPYLLIMLALHYSAAISVEMFYPFRATNGDQNLPPFDDNTHMVRLSSVFPFFGVNYTTLHVNNNGLISFNSSVPNPSHIPKSFPLADNSPVVAPFWADIDTRGIGTVWFRETNISTILSRAREDIQKAFDSSISFQPQFAFIATWDGVGYYNNKTDRINTFQCVLVSDGSLSFAIFLYGDIEWSQRALVGVNAGDKVRNFTVPGSLTSNIINVSTTSNIGVPGVWIFQLNGEISPINVNCSEEITPEYIWPETPRNTTAYFTCPNNPDFSVSRECSIDGVWKDFDEQGCGVLASQLKKITMTAQNNLINVMIEDLVANLSEIVSRGSEVDQTEANFNIISDTLANISSFITESSVVINETIIANMTQTLNSLLQWPRSAIRATSSSRTVETFEALVSLYAQQVPVNSTQNFKFTLLSLAIERSSIENLQRAGRSFAIVGETLTQVDEITFDRLPSHQNAVIRLPAAIFAQIRDQRDLGVSVGYYETAILFPVSSPSDALRQAQVCSNVIAATVGQNMTIENLEDAVTIAFRLENKVDVFTAPGSEKCVSWDFGLENWTSRGCTTSIGQDGVILCRCNHLTNFAVIVDTCSNLEDCQTTESPAVITITSLPTANQLENLNNSFTNLTVETVEAAVSMLAQVVEQTQSNEAEQNGAVLDTTANYLMELAIFLNDSNVTINSNVIKDVAQVVSALLQWNPENIVVASGSSAIQSFEVVVYLFAQQLSLNQTQNFTLQSLTVISELRSVASLSTAGRSFAIGNNEYVIDDEDEVISGKLSPRQDAAISLPASLFESITDREDVGIFFALYDTPTLFPVNGGRNPDAPRRTEVGSRVLAATVGPDLNFSNLIDNVTIVLRLVTEEDQFTASGSEVCVSWSFSLQDWTTEGCTIDVTHLEDGIITCSCNHLTNFAVLVDICSRQENCQPLNEGVRDLLTYVSYIGISISIVSLTITIVTLLIFKKLRQKDTSKYHIQLSLALLVMFTVSLALVAMSVQNVTDPYEGCVTISILVHYFTLVAVMWMGAEALLMFQKLVTVFYQITTKFVIRISIICWTTPSVFVIIPLIVDLANGTDDIIIRRTNSTEDLSFCFLSHEGAFWGAFLAPILAVMIFNIIIFIWVIVVVSRYTRGTDTNRKEINIKTIIHMMMSISGVMFLFGLTWLFAILTFSETGIVFQALFTIFNSFQGFFIFLFYCVFNKDAIESWKELLSCGIYKSKLLHPSKVTSAAKYKSKQTNNGSKGQNLSSEILKSNYESVTLTKGNDYEKAPLETKIDFDTNSPNKTPEQNQNSTEKADPITQDVHTTVNQNKSTNDSSHQSGIQSGEMEGKKVKKITTSLKARFRRYSTKKMSKHHVEEVEVDFHSDSGSGGEEDAATQL